MIVVGFSGTRRGLTDAQRSALAVELGLDATEVHHGDCVGADHQAHLVARFLGLRVVVHPPRERAWRAWCRGAEVREPDGYLRRNSAIVAESERLVACPSSAREQGRGSGTWHAVRVARRTGVPLRVLLPDGRVMKEDPGAWRAKAGSSRERRELAHAVAEGGVTVCAGCDRVARLDVVEVAGRWWALCEGCR